MTIQQCGLLPACPNQDSSIGITGAAAAGAVRRAGTGLTILCGLLAIARIAGPGLAAEISKRDLTREMDALVAAYPDFLASHDGKEIVWKDHTRMTIDDGLSHKDAETRVEKADIEDQFYTPYLLGNAGFPPGLEIDPGRVRYQPLFSKMYGDCRSGGVSDDLVEVPWLAGHSGGKITFTRINGAAQALQKVSEELDALPASLIIFVKKTAGTFNCRRIAGSAHLSMHAYGAAIDIDTKHTTYWRWEKPGPDGRIAWKNQIPIEIVRIFEKHGFIWGGKWYHYDTMHFEYRPELIALGIKEEPKP